ncbi:protein-disulfide reductase DsbD family protein [Methylobacterium nodulans]|uniref:Cytochrome c biogenesis protein transmembrane region n=1 Tax=Methylobacterium nodulans (strain LMG 21967 / CNCM I-2342 / ORS 2060) TaxID=460265 RepID=B8IMZ5_METNO|nr:protein-disulfide reductase DsbD domain-containing protein [Methylobacterium nodulans]ACL62111.1 cytochrome c biogenesis protein transmembrane region [Methylobacterium nodulans ORS 2060]
MRHVPSLLVAIAALAALPAAAQAPRINPKYADLVRAELVAEPGAVAAGQPFTVGVRLVMKPHWHVYWRNPGDSGLAPEIAWALPPGFAAGAIAWPVPARIPVSELVNFGYEGKTLLTATLTPPATLDTRSVTLRAKVSYLVCERECIPGEANVSATLPVAPPGTSVRPDPRQRDLFEAARAQLPQPSPWPSRVTAAGDTLTLHLDAPGLKGEAIRDVAFFPYSETVIEHAAPQDVSVDAGGLHLGLKRSSLNPSEPVERLDGVLALTEDTGSGPVRHAFALGEAPAQAVAAVSPPVSAPAAPEAPAGLWQAAFLAFLGGILLNLMPCVFPVLSIKVLGLVRQAGESPGRVRLHGLAYTAGVLASFLGLAALLVGFRAGGAQIGWGFQLQSPLVVASLAYGLFALGLSLSGVVHLGGRFVGIGDGLTRRAGLEGSFFTGVLATVVATPCTAPFMGVAVGFALTQGATLSLAVFAALGLGLALPFLLLTLWPAAIRRLPRPGPWMETLRGFLAFPLYATVAWLVWVLSQQVGPGGLFLALIGLVLVGFCAWMLERARQAGPWGRSLAQGAAVLGVLALGILVAALDRDRAQAVPVAVAGGPEPFTQARLDGLLAEGRPVFVNMTAAWCITCQVNERTSLSTAAVRQAFRARDVVYLKGDWTNQNPEITRVLEAHGRSGVPLYLLYRGPGDAQVLPQILTESTVLAALESLAPPRRAAALDAPASAKE